jgi:hypothetical protein
MTQLENRTSLLARVESTYGVDSIAPNLAATPSPFVTDAISCSALDVKINTTQLTRGNYSPSLSQDITGVGRMLVQLTFKTELKASGVLGVPPRIGRLFKGAAFQETAIANTAAATIGAPVAGPANASAAAATIVAGITKTTAPTTMFDTYRINVTTGGAPATAKFTVTGVGFPELDATQLNSLVNKGVTNSVAGVITVTGSAVNPIFTFTGTFIGGEFIEIFAGGIRFYYQVAVGDTLTTIAAALNTKVLIDPRFVGSVAAAGVITVAVAAATNTGGAGEFLSAAIAQVVTLGQSGAQVTIPVWTGALVAGEYFDIPLLQPGVRYDPVSDFISSLTFYVYMDGTLIKITGARGTFSTDGAAAAYPMVNWTFTGVYNDPIDSPLPTTMSFETSKPFKVELAQLAIYGLNNVCASKFSFDIANTIDAKECINASEGYDEIRITDRMPIAAADPQSEAPSVLNPWWRMRREDTTRFHVAVGRRGGTGNIVRVQANNVNIKDAPFANRNKIRAYDYQFHLAKVSGAGNDECSFVFA